MGLLNKHLSRVFFKLGSFIGKYPKYFIIVPTVLSLVLATGLIRLDYVNDVEYLFTLTNGPSRMERNIVEKYFPQNTHENFTPSRLTAPGRFARIIVTSEDGGSLLRNSTWNEILTLNDYVQNVTVEWKEKVYNYSGICAKWKDECYGNEFLEMGRIVDKFEQGTLKLSYPVMFDPVTFKTYLLAHNFGGITFENGSTFNVKSVDAIVLNYFVVDDGADDNKRGEKWESEILQGLDKADSLWKHIRVFRLTYYTLTREQEVNAFSVIPYFSATILLMNTFVVMTSMTGDWVKSKPWVGFMGITSALLGTISSVGILCYMDVSFIGINLAVPFISLGIGIDDTFVMLAAWWRTSSKDPVHERMAHCYSEAAVSITITTLTDMLSFYVGLLSPTPSIRIFSAYAGTSVLCIYIWHVFFFGGSLALSGYYEAENMHSVLWWKKATPKSKAEKLSKFSRWFMVGGTDPKDPGNTEDFHENSVMTFFRDHFAPFISKTYVKVGILIVFVIYILVSLFGLTILEEGLRRDKLVRYDSYMHHFVVKEDRYFRDYPYRFQVIVTTPLDYSLKSTQEKIDKMLHEFTHMPHMTEEYAENWLRDFTRYIENYDEFLNFNITSEKDFNRILKKDYLRDYMHISEDILFNEDFSKILATRYILQSRHVWDALIEKNMLLNARQIARDQTEFNVTVYHPWFHYVDQAVVVRELTLTLVSIAAGIVMVIAVLFIPSFISSLFVFFSIASIELGVLGFMSLWNVSLDLISVLCLIMCIGFSVDFSAHVSYAYVSSKYESTEDRVKDTMHSLGLPILQAAMSTIIGVSSLYIVPSYVFNSFFKVVVLVMIFAVFHGLFLLPVLLSIVKPERIFLFTSRKTFKLKQIESSQL